MMKRLLIGLSAVALVACNEGSDGNHSTSRMNMDQVEADFAPMAETQSLQKTAVTNTLNVRDTPAVSYLAYRYGYGLVMPSASVKSTSDKHMQVCREAGPSKCQITGSSANSYSDEDNRATLSMRVEPAWLDTFMTGLKQDVEEVDGKIQSADTTVEDLTRALLDTDARLTAKRKLRTRLEKLLETRNAKLPDLLALEREMARVQGEIESATANLKALRARVSMSVVTITYTSERSAVSRSAVSPIGSALKGFVRTVAEGIGGVITVIAVLLPWLIFLIIPGFFALRWFWRRPRKAKAQKTPLA